MSQEITSIAVKMLLKFLTVKNSKIAGIAKIFFIPRTAWISVIGDKIVRGFMKYMRLGEDVQIFSSVMNHGTATKISSTVTNRCLAQISSDVAGSGMEKI